MILPLYKFCEQHRTLRLFDFPRWLVVIRFNHAPVSNNYEYKSVLVEMSKINCFERRPHVPKKICKHKISCRNKRPKFRKGNHCKTRWDSNAHVWSKWSSHSLSVQGKQTDKRIRQSPVNGTRLENEQSPNNLLDNLEIIDDEELFVINVGLVDPCWVITPVKYKNGCS